MIDISDLTRLLEQHGGAPERWPHDERDAALALIHAEPRARALWREALALETALDEWLVPEAAPDLALRIAAAADNERGLAAWLRLDGSPAMFWRGALLASIPVLLGFLIGVTQMPGAAALASPQAHAELAHLSAWGLLPADPEAPR